MMKSHRISRISGAIVFALGLSTSALAADTASSIRGTILGASGDVAANTSITIIHEPSGTRRTLSTNESGAFFAQGLRVGGPYTIEIDSDTYKDKELKNIYISLGEVFRLTEQLENEDIERIQVTGSSSIYDYASGSESTFYGDQISKSASFNRDIKDIARKNPMAVIGNDGTSLYLAGSNPRYNSLKVDGVNLNDDFGLAGNGYPTERSPIAFDSIEQLSVAIAPFSAKEGGFSGGQLSVVTKSGTNEFHGNVFFEKAQDSWAGDPENPETGDDIKLNFEEESYGATLGGPIIKDKLFFFASYETFEAPSTINKGPSGSGVANETSNISQSDIDRVVNIAQSRYGFDAGSWNASIPLEDEKYSLKLDWNINDDHRASFTYGHGFSNSAGNAGSGRSNELYLSSHWYNRSNEYDTYVGQLFSYWNENFSTEMKLSYKESVNGQVPVAGYSFGEVKIDHNGGSINLGPDDSRHANRLTNETLQFRLSAEYLTGDHAISFGWEYEQVDVFNIFMQHYLGSWYFDSIDDFEAGTADWFEYQNNPSLDSNDAAASFNLKTHSFYVEDSWDVTDNVNLTYGLRYETITNEDEPNANALFEKRHGYSNNENLDGKGILLPRVGFTWDLDEQVESLKLRGGMGLFSGGRPNVWISNSFTNDGSRIALYRTFGDQVAADTFLQDADPNSVPQHALDIIGNTSLDGARSNIDAISPDFDIPSTWQYSLAADYVADFSEIGLGDNWNMSAEVLFKDVKDDVVWQDLSRQIDTSRGVNGYTVDGRPIYGFAFNRDSEPYQAGDSGRDARDILMTNIDGGKSVISTFTLAKKFDNGLDFSFSYANSDIEDGFAASGTSSNTSYEFHPVYDPQSPRLGTSSYETKHRLTLNLRYDAEFFAGYKTTFHAFWERKSARPYSWVLRKNFGSSGLDGDLDLHAAYLPYIPTGADDPAVDFDNGMSYAEIVSQLETVGISTEGGPLGKNQHRGPWVSSLDLRIEQELPGFIEGHKGLLYFDIDNAWALIDEDSARVYRNPFGNSTSDLFSYSINDAGQYVYSSQNLEAGDSPVRFEDRASTWSMKIGIKYSF
jgi:outer membrane receptor for ferrienterochelin and colicin